MDPDQQLRLRELCDLLAEAQAGAGEVSELNRLLDGDPDAQREYLRLIDLQSTLRWRVESLAVHQGLADLKSTGAEPFSAERPGFERRAVERLEADPLPVDSPFRARRSRLSAVVGLAAGLLIAAWGLDRGKEPPQPQPDVPHVAQVQPPPLPPDPPAKPSTEPQPEPPIVAATVVEASMEAGEDWKAGRKLAPGLVKIDQGAVRILFACGAEVAIEGPCAFELVDARRGVLRHGVLTASAPAWATGFSIASPRMEFTEAGGEFGLYVDLAGKTRVGVFRGEVHVEVDSPFLGFVQPFHLTRDEGLEMDAVGAVTTAILGDNARFAHLRRTVDPRAPSVGNGSFEYPQSRDLTTAVAAGWTLMSHPLANADQMDVRAGIRPAVVPGSTVPPPPDGRQWAYLTARTFEDGRSTYTSMHQAVGLASPGVTYLLEATLAPSAPRDREVRCTVGLYAGDPEEGPKNPLQVWQGQPLPAKGQRFQATYRLPPDSPYFGDALFLMIEAVPSRSPGVRQVLVDDVRMSLMDSAAPQP